MVLWVGWRPSAAACRLLMVGYFHLVFDAERERGGFAVVIVVVVVAGWLAGGFGWDEGGGGVAVLSESWDGERLSCLEDGFFLVVGTVVVGASETREAEDRVDLASLVVEREGFFSADWLLLMGTWSSDSSQEASSSDGM